ncbi:hypothetical protein CRUP_006361, partial [Coryphaenoides rupestris]
HYSIKKAGAALGFGSENVILLSTDERGRVIPADLEAKIIDAKQKGQLCDVEPSQMMGVPLQCSAILVREKEDMAIQCGRHVDIFKFWLMWKAKYLYNKIKNREGYQMVFDGVPQHTNVCFWYLPLSLRGMPEGKERWEKLHRVAPKIKALMMESGTTMVGYQPQGQKVNFFRMVISNPAATQSDIDFLINEIERLGHD